MGHQIFRTSRRLFEQLARRQPLVLVLEDWHWADESSADLLKHLLGLTAKVPILFLLANRPESQGAAMAVRQALASEAQLVHRHRSIDLMPLPPAASRELMDRLLDGGHLPPDLEEKLLQRVAGNPFYLGELVRMLMSTHAIVRDSQTGAWHGTGQLLALPLPDTVEGVILARVDRLEDTAKQLLKAASVVGRIFLYRVLAAIAHEQDELDVDIGKLKAAALVQARHSTPELELMFRHPLIQQATYGSLLTDQRQRLHRQVGECIECLFADRLEEFYSVLAHHYAEAQEWEKAQQYLFKAGDQAARIAADAEALDHYQKALAVAAASANSLVPLERAELDIRIGEALFRLGRHEAGLKHVLAALPTLGITFPVKESDINKAIALKYVARGKRRILRIAAKRLAVAEPTVDTDVHSLVCRALEVIGTIDFYRTPARFLLGVLTLLEFTESQPLRREYVIATAALAAAYDSVGYYRMAASLHKKAVRLAADLNDDMASGMTYLAKGMREYCFGNWSGAAESYTKSMEHFHAAGHLRYRATAMWTRRSVLLSKGDPAWMQRLAEDAQAAMEAQDDHEKAWAMNFTGSCHLYCRDFGAGALAFEQACVILEGIPDYWLLVYVLAAWSVCLVHERQHAKALDLLARSDILVSTYRIGGICATHARLKAADAYLHLLEHAQDSSVAELSQSSRKLPMPRMHNLNTVVHIWALTASQKMDPVQTLAFERSCKL
nr:hypothetical protein [Noviherbaspirillum malthae]